MDITVSLSKNISLTQFVRCRVSDVGEMPASAEFTLGFHGFVNRQRTLGATVKALALGSAGRVTDVGGQREGP